MDLSSGENDHILQENIFFGKTKYSINMRYKPDMWNNDIISSKLKAGKYVTEISRGDDLIKHCF